MKYFISYTLKDSFINKTFLFKIKKFYLKKNIDTYIDILDNIYLDSPYYSSNSIFINKNNFLINPCQEYLQNQLFFCSKLIVLVSPLIFKSNWVKEEILFAKKHKIPISYISPSYFLIKKEF